ncbi:MAG: hypothetical protein KY453_00435 [Gemmatimonadetes bacterium]|nr:hypothetical protein [Gemmatimonadota bacterium]
MNRPARACLLLLLLPALDACAGAPATPPLPPPLAYRVPSAMGPLLYVQADSTTIEVTAGGRTFPVAAASAATWALDFEPAAEGLRVTADLRDLDARLDNPLTGARRADESDVAGPAVFTLGPRGEAELVRAPSAGGPAGELFSTAPLVHHLFPRLPGRTVSPGEAWSDTIRYSTDEGAGEVSAVVALTYVVAGDTLVAGLPYLLVRFRGRDERSSAGEAGGMAFGQEVEGPVEGFFLWDRGRGALHALEQRSDLSGTMSVAVASTPLDVRVRSVMRVGLVGG